ncbi:MAG TPA: NUDIX hydrolase [Armatimonadota bacterium]|nr:NUDIX hydrolase [Armatimonadota bacterium]HQK93703.1 NUDIX hydrolase [Armatimonadota bacterium]
MDSDAVDLREVTLSSETIFSGRVVSLRVDTVRLPGGRTSTREVVAHPGAVAIVPLTDDGQIVLIRQYRQAAGQVLLEIPAGTLDKGEAPEACARRELAEETGLLAGRLVRLIGSYLAPGYSSELLHVFLGVDLGPADGPDVMDADENIETLTVPVAEAVEWVLDGRVCDAKTICGILLADRWLRHHGGEER